ncbi:MAG: DUF4384 domain-containing protein [Treponema sp.]|nr:DUF4384 domain-containing protein [Treponema sp.]
MKQIRLFLLFLAVTRLSGQTGEGSFDWTLSLSNQRELIAISLERPVELTTGDRITFILKSRADCFVYVIARDSENAVAVLYSNPVRNGETLNLGPIRITPPAGSETIFFVVSSRERSGLSQAVTTLRANPNSARAGQELLNQVYGLRRDSSLLGETPEQPLAMGGSVRGTDDTAGNTGGLLFSGTHTYVKILTLEH